MALKPADIAVVSELLDQALALPVDEREAWLSALPAQHEKHKETLRAMLAQAVKLDTDSLLNAMPRLSMDESVTRSGDLVGPYRLIREIGRGGMGTVWLAERADGAFTRQVALKLPRLAWGAVLANRMAREREIGMRLEHSNIARLYDAGLDERGRPYLALEFIDGQPIDTWCDAQRLDVRQRLRLLVQVAKAVSYAHGRLVVHRDLKPSNVLVTADGQVHLLDFGIGKLLEASAPEDQSLTNEQGRLLTPHYASPEQLAGEAMTVQSDVYGLGVLAYVLLTRQTPYAPKRATPLAIEDAVVNGEALPASQRAPDRATAAELRGEIDAILAKALRREPKDRYASAEALVDDIERLLEGRVVLAQPDSWHYRIGKTLKRHRLPYTVGALTFAAVLSLAGFALAEARHADEQARRAQQAAERARVVKDFVIDIFTLDAPGTANGTDARELPVEWLLERGARLIEPKFASQPELQAELLGVVAQIMLDMQAHQLAIEYASRYRSATSGAAPDVKAGAALLLARALKAGGIFREAVLVLREGLPLATRPDLRVELQLELLDLHLDSPVPTEIAKLLDTLRADLAGINAPLLRARADEAEARFRAQADQFDAAIALHERALATARAAEGPGSRVSARLQLRLAETLAEAGREGEARTVSQQAVARLRSLGGTDDIEATLIEAAGVRSTGRRAWQYDEAASVFARAVSVIDKFGRRLPPQVRAKVEDQQACVELEFGHAEKGYELAVRSARTVRGNELYGHYDSCLGWGAMVTGHHVEAETEYQRYIGHLWHSHRCDTECAAEVYIGMAQNRLMAGRSAEARSLLDGLPSRDDRFDGRAPDRPGWKWLQAARARIELDSGQPSVALALLQGMPDGRYFMNDSAALRAEAECRSGRVEPALAVLDERVRATALEEHPHSPALADLRARLGVCQMRAGRRAAAQQSSRLAHQALHAQAGVSPAYRKVLRELDVLLAQGGSIR